MYGHVWRVQDYVRQQVDCDRIYEQALHLAATESYTQTQKTASYNVQYMMLVARNAAVCELAH